MQNGKALRPKSKGSPITHGAIRRIGSGHPLRRDPARVLQNNMHIQNRRSEPDLSTSLRIGHFYFAPTGVLIAKESTVNTEASSGHK